MTTHSFSPTNSPSNEELCDASSPPAHSSQISYLDLFWDQGDAELRDKVALEQAVLAAVHAKQSIPFYRAHYSRFSIQDIERITSIEEFVTMLPEVNKHHVAQNSFRAFIPDWLSWNSATTGTLNKGTGGTTMKPVSVLFPKEDFRAMARTIARPILFDHREEPEQLEGLTCVGLYHGDHITNTIYSEALAELGITMFGRVSTKTDAKSNYEWIQEIQPNILLGPPEDPSGKQTKGITLDRILEFDARNRDPNAWRLNHRVNPKFRMLLWSSMPMSTGMQDYILEHLGIPYQQSQWGNTEAGAVAATCSHHPLDHHLSYGPSLTSVKHENGNRVCGEDEVGYVVVSRTGSVRDDGINTVPIGSTFLNYRTGDWGHITQSKGKVCGCGRNTGVLKNLHRREHRRAKLVFGCQAD